MTHLAFYLHTQLQSDTPCLLATSVTCQWHSLPTIYIHNYSDTSCLLLPYTVTVTHLAFQPQVWPASDTACHLTLKSSKYADAVFCAQAFCHPLFFLCSSVILFHAPAWRRCKPSCGKMWEGLRREEREIVSHGKWEFPSVHFWQRRLRWNRSRHP